MTMIGPQMRKSRKMLAVEESQGQRLEDLLPELVAQFGPSDAAKELGITKQCLAYWMLKFRLRILRVVLRDGERVRIVPESRRG